jgi:hypothetical protein
VSKICESGPGKNPRDTGTSLAADFCSPNRGHASFLFILYGFLLNQSQNAHRLAKGN